MNNNVEKIAEVLNKYFNKRGWNNVFRIYFQNEICVNCHIFYTTQHKQSIFFEVHKKLNEKILKYFYVHVDLALKNKYKIKNSIVFCFVGDYKNHRRYYSNDGQTIVY